MGIEIQRDRRGVVKDSYASVNNIYLNGLRIAAMTPSGELTYFLTDQVDSVKVVVNESGRPVSRTEFLPYGETWFQEGGENFAPKFNSQELDKESGLYFYNARYYDAGVGRFVTADRVVDGEFDTQGWNRYSYVKGNPVGYRDPTGNWSLGGLFARMRDAEGNNSTIAPAAAGQSGDSVAKGSVENNVAGAKDSGSERTAKGISGQNTPIESHIWQGKIDKFVKDDKPACNVYLGLKASEKGIYLPDDYAVKMIDHMKTDENWRTVPRTEEGKLDHEAAQRLANEGKFTSVGYRPESGTGHVAVVKEGGALKESDDWATHVPEVHGYKGAPGEYTKGQLGTHLVPSPYKKTLMA